MDPNALLFVLFTSDPGSCSVILSLASPLPLCPSFHSDKLCVISEMKKHENTWEEEVTVLCHSACCSSQNGTLDSIRGLGWCLS